KKSKRKGVHVLLYLHIERILIEGGGGGPPPPPASNRASQPPRPPPAPSALAKLGAPVNRHGSPVNYAGILRTQIHDHLGNIVRLRPHVEVRFGHRPPIRRRIHNAWHNGIHIDVVRLHLFRKRIKQRQHASL